MEIGDKYKMQTNSTKKKKRGINEWMNNKKKRSVYLNCHTS